MTSSTKGAARMTPQACARAAGILYLCIIVGALFVPFAVAPSGISANSAGGSGLSEVARIRASMRLYALSGVIQSLILVCDVVVAMLFYELMKPVSKSLSLVAATFRLMFVAIAGANLFNHYAPLILLGGWPSLQGLGQDQQQALAMAFLGLRTAGFDVALVFFGFHCAMLGWLIYRSTFLPRVIGLLLSVGGGGGYLANILFQALDPPLRSALFPIVMIPAGIAEILLATWLAVVGVNIARWTHSAMSAPG